MTYIELFTCKLGNLTCSYFYQMILLQFKRTFPNLTRYTYIAEYSAVVGESYLDQLAFELFTCKLGDLTCSYFYQTILLQFKITFPNLKRYT